MAARRGFGTVDLDQIDFDSEVTAPLNEFDSEEVDPPAIMAAVRQTACEQGLLYRDRRREMIDRFHDQFIYLQEGEVVWNGPDPSIITSHREFSNDKPGQALWLKLVDPEEREGENYAVYDECLTAMAG